MMTLRNLTAREKLIDDVSFILLLNIRGRFCVKTSAIAPLPDDRGSIVDRLEEERNGTSDRRERAVFSVRSGAIVEQDTLINPKCDHGELRRILVYFSFSLSFTLRLSLRLLSWASSLFSASFGSLRQIRSLSEVLQAGHQQELLDEKLGIEDGDVRGSADQGVRRRG